MGGVFAPILFGPKPSLRLVKVASLQTQVSESAVGST